MKDFVLLLLFLYLVSKSYFLLYQSKLFNSNANAANPSFFKLLLLLFPLTNLYINFIILVSYKKFFFLIKSGVVFNADDYL